MLMHSACPQCGQKKDYIPEQVGQVGQCQNCSAEFLLKANDGRVAWQLISATCVVVAVIGILVARFAFRFSTHDRTPFRSAAVSYDRSLDDD